MIVSYISLISLILCIFVLLLIMNGSYLLYTSCVLGLHSFTLFNDMNYLEEKIFLIKWKSKKQSVVK
jgi:hypothetical protein